MDVRSLSFYHTHTGKKLDITYFRNGQYDDTALVEMNHFLRDFRTNDIHPIAPGLLDILHSVLVFMDSQGTFEVISAFRSAKTNDALRRQSRSVAKHSLHMQGKAIDVRLTGSKTSDLKKAAIALKTGGVGYYSKSDFVHLDTGRFRTW